MNEIKATFYAPEIGQAIFGAPYSEYQVPAFGESALRMVLDEMERVYGNRYQNREPMFGSNDGFILPDGALGPDISYRAYDWGDCECGTEECQGKCDWSKPNLAYDGLEFRWYKHSRRGLSCNKELTPDEWAKWLQKALFYLRDQDVQL